MSERLKFQGRLAEKDLEARKFEVQISGFRESLRDLLDPFEPVIDLKADLIADQALRLASCVGAYRQVQAEIREIKKLLVG